MNKKQLLLSALLMVATPALQAQQNVTPDALRQWEKMVEQDASLRALSNAATANGFKALSKNQSNRAKKSTHFSDEVKSSGITDQKQSGRCWLFTGLNVLRQQMMKKTGMKNFQFSQVYLFFYDQLEKSNLFLQGVIDYRQKPMDDKMVEWLFKHPLSDGGTYTGVADLVEKYGVVPADVMPETYSSERTSEVASLLTTKLREYGMQLRADAAKGKSVKALEQQKKEMLGSIYRILVLAFGEPVKSFQWAPTNSEGAYTEALKTYTPQTFRQTFADTDLQHSVMLMNDPSRPYNKVYEIDYDRHLYDGHNWLYVNLPIDEIKQMAIASIKDGKSMYFSCDVGKCLDRTTGWLDVDNYDYASLLGTEFKMDKKQRVESFDSGSSHAMTLMAVDLDADGRPTKWKVENSWGKTGADGYLIMTDRWFDEYMFRLVVDQKYAPAKVKDLLQNSKPIRLPAWDPMFLVEE